MKIADLSSAQLRDQLKNQGLRFQTGPFGVCLRSPIGEIVKELKLLYGYFPVLSENEFVDLHLSLEPPIGLRRWVKPQVICCYDGMSPFPPLARGHAYPFLETSLNWFIYSEVSNYLIIHAAAVERGDHVAILPGLPGAGKSTLTAALVHRGWRLLTDELTLLTLGDPLVVPIPRPVSLKNESIKVIREFTGPAMSTIFNNTAKGSIGYMQPPRESVDRMFERAAPSWIVFPNYRIDTRGSSKVLGKAATFSRLSEGLVNYTLLGTAGFQAVTSLLDAVSVFEITYRDLGMAIDWFDRLDQ